MKKKTILLFDDDAAFLELAHLIFDQELYSIFMCSTLRNVIEVVEDVTPHLIFMDNIIPTIGGVVATQQLKAHPDFKTIPVIFMTAGHNIESLALSAQADDFISKPFDLAELELKTSKYISVYS